MMKRAMRASVRSDSEKSRLKGFSKLNNSGVYCRSRSSSRIASKIGLRSGVKRPRINTMFDVMLVMTPWMCLLFSNR